jgi:hypothetical protein
LIYHARGPREQRAPNRNEIYLSAVAALVDSDEGGKFDPSRAQREGSISHIYFERAAATAFERVANLHNAPWEQMCAPRRSFPGANAIK